MTTIRRPNRRPIRGLSEMVNELCTASGKRRYSGFPMRGCHGTNEER